MAIYLVRHGQTDWNLEGRLQGTCDIELNQTGIDEAKKAAEVISKIIKPDLIFTSRQKRAKKTAEILAEFFSVDLMEIDNLQEKSFGIWEKERWMDLKTTYASDFDLYSKDRRYFKIKGSESYDDTARRAIAALVGIYRKYKDKDILIVTHGAVIMSVLTAINDSDWTEEMDKYLPGNLDLVELDGEKLLAHENF